MTNLTLTPRVPPQLRPRVLVSGSSEAGLAAARALDALPVQYPAPAAENAVHAPSFGIRVGIVARDDEEAAWSIATARFPEDRAGQLKHQLAMKVSDSHWHRQLSEAMQANGMREGTYWMWPFHNYQTFCPYIVGDHGQVAEQIALYRQAGYRTFILDIPPSREELDHIQAVFERQEVAA